MNTYEVFLLGIGLSMDCLAVSITCASLPDQSLSSLLKIPLLFGLFQGFMFLLGWFIGDQLSLLIESVDHWIAFGILVFIGLKMIVESFRKENGEKHFDINRLRILLLLSLATSIDAVMAGMGFGLLAASLAKTSLIISSLTFFISLGGILFGRFVINKSRLVSGRNAIFLGGLVLIGLSFIILSEHHVF